MSARRLRIVHTSDWHLGQTLGDLPREEEHRAFLAWLAERIEEERADALLVCGDVFDTANPSAAAQAAWYGFLAEARRRVPALQTVVVAGNHDSPARLEAPAPVVGALGVRVVGLLPRRDGGVDAESLVVPLNAADGSVAAWVAAVPYLRVVDAGGFDEEGGDGLVEGVRAIYAGALEVARARREEGQALVATGHLFMHGATTSDGSERKILGGNLNAIPDDVFPEDVTYAALGHLHRPQKVAGRPAVRYSGSVIPLALDEEPYPHQVLVVDLEEGRLASVRELRVPRRIGILRIPEEGPGPVEEVLGRLGALPAAKPIGEGPDLRPYLEVRVLLEKPEPALRALVEEALEGKDARLVKITATGTGTGAPLSGGADADLTDLRPEEVFRRKWAKEHGGEPAPEHVAAFHELLEAAEREERP
ncbi:MAG: exonuclease SbcCD subunit D C-terminal domain-containing protein [Thermoanaerobaculia bacterium]